MKKKSIIKARHLSVGYGNTVILKNLSFDIHEGEIFVIMGGSGCGKSTLMKNLIGLYSPLSGRIHVDDMELTNCTDKTYQSILQKIGVMYQDGALLGSMSLAENLMLPIEEYSGLPHESACSLVELKLGLVNLQGSGDLLPSELSGGMKKRAGIARAMSLNPKILFFDEPSAGLDPITSAEMDKLLMTINRIMGTTMIIVSHELPSILNIADRVIMLDKKTKGIVALGNPHELKQESSHPEVMAFFNRKAMN